METVVESNVVAFFSLCLLKNISLLKHKEHKTLPHRQSHTASTFSIVSHLLVHSDGIQPGVHDVHPAVLGREHEQGHQRRAQVVEVVLAVDPHVAWPAETLGLVGDAHQIVAVTVVERALEQLPKMGSGKVSVSG